MALSTIKFSQFAMANLSNTTNQIVGVSSPSGGTNFQVSFPLSWTTAGRPSSPGLATFGYNTSLSQYEYWNGSAWVQLASGGSGSVNSGSINQLAWYMANGTAVSGLNTANSSVLTTNSSGAPLWATTLPAVLTLPQPIIEGVTDGSNASSGDVGYFVSSVIGSGSAVTASNNSVFDITSINIPAGDYDIWGNVSTFDPINQMTISQGWISGSSASKPDTALLSGFNAGNTHSDFQNYFFSVPEMRFKSSSSFTVYLSCYISSRNGTTVQGWGAIYARVRR